MNESLVNLIEQLGITKSSDGIDTAHILLHKLA